MFTMAAPNQTYQLTRLSQLKGVQIANSLISLKSLFEGRHYSGIKPGLRCAWAGR